MFIVSSKLVCSWVSLCNYVSLHSLIKDSSSLTAFHSIDRLLAAVLGIVSEVCTGHDHVEPGILPGLSLLLEEKLGIRGRQSCQ